MHSRYGYFDKEKGRMFLVPPGKEEFFFEAIEALTGLNRALAEMVLEQRPIEHPRFRFGKTGEE